MPELTDETIQDTAELLERAAQFLQGLVDVALGLRTIQPAAVQAGAVELRDQLQKQADRLGDVLHDDALGGMAGPQWVEVQPDPQHMRELPRGARVGQAKVRDGLLNTFTAIQNGAQFMSVAHARSAVLQADGTPAGRPPTLGEVASAHRYFFPYGSRYRPLMALLVSGADPTNLLQLFAVSAEVAAKADAAPARPSGLIGGQ